MPSSVGHAIGAVVAGWSVAGVPTARRQVVTQGVILAALGVAPDLDLLIGRHRAEVHSLGATLVVATAAALWRWPLGATRTRIWAAACLAWGSHILLDMVGTDLSPPSGVMAAWPISDAYVHLADVFPTVRRRWWLPGFVTGNLWAIGFELLVLAPVAAVVYWWRRPRARPVHE